MLLFINFFLQALATKTLPEEFDVTTRLTIKIVNFVKRQALNIRIFKKTLW